MAVDQSAVREGTRWDFRGNVVVVDEVTSKSVIHYDEQGLLGVEVTPVEIFLKVAADPVTARHSSLVKRVGRAIEDNGERKDLGLEVLAYLLERVGPPLPLYVAPVAPAPAPVVKPAPELPAVAEPIEDPAPAAPACADVDEGPAEYERIARDFAVSDDRPRGLKRRTGWQA